MDELYTRFDGVFFEKTRLSLVTLLHSREMMTFKSLKEYLGMTDGALYTHLEKLITAGYVEKRKELAGTTVQTVYKLTDNGNEEFLAYLEFLQSMLQSREEVK